MWDLIERFYARAWNSWDDAAVTSLLDERFVFRGSLGDEVTGRNGFRGYRDKVRAAFPDFHNEILDLVVEGDRAAVRLRYTGHHRGGHPRIPGHRHPRDLSRGGVFHGPGGTPGRGVGSRRRR